jgi:hypothetical protein
MRNRGSIDALAVAVCITALAIIGLSLGYLPPRVDTAIYSEVGEKLAQQAVALLPKGGRIVVIARDTEAYRQPAMEISLKAFEDVVSGATKEIVMHPVQVDPLRPVEVPPGDFYEAIRRAKTNDVIVSFLGPPILDAEQQAKLPAARAKIVALCTGTMAEQANLHELARSGLLHAAIVNQSRKDVPSNDKAKLTFEQLYSVVRAGELVAPSTDRTRL